MSIALVVGSEEQLSSGIPWCKRLAGQADSIVHIIVPGKDRKTLIELARRKSSELLDVSAERIKVAEVDADPAALLESLESASCKTLLLVYRSNDLEFQRKLFEEAMMPAIWLSGGQPPPVAPNQVWAMFRRPSLITTLACERLFGFAPASTLCDEVDLETDNLEDEVRSAIESKVDTSGQIVLCGIEDTESTNRLYQAGLSMLETPSGPTIALVHSGHSLVETVAMKIRRWAASVAPPMERQQRVALAEDLRVGSKPNLEFFGLISASSMLAAFGLLQNSAAVIIGAMLIAPLMTPILGAGLALTQGNRPLFRSAFWTIVLGFAGALTASILFGWLFWIFDDPLTTSEMWARCRPSPLDFCVGMVGGIAASYARTRSHLSSALAGAAIAAALVPPLATAGLQIAFGIWGTTEEGIPVVGPLLLVTVNVLTIMIGSSFVLWARGMRVDRGVPMKDRWVLRMFALLSLLVLLILIWTLHPFPDS